MQTYSYLKPIVEFHKPFKGLDGSNVEEGGAGGSAQVALVKIARTNELCRTTFSLPIVEGTNLSSSSLDSRKLRNRASRLE